ncbi:MAG: hypothetical protein ACQCN4_06575 [Candidatus Bathyarchaeia archaeon]
MEKRLDVTQILSPEEGIQLTWALTNGLSSNPEARKAAETTKELLQKKMDKAQTETDVNEKKYVSNAISLIQATYRNLATARNYFDLNTKEANERANKEEQIIRDYEKSINDSHSNVLKIVEVVLGAIGGSVLSVLTTFFQNAISQEVQILLIFLGFSLGGGLVYFIVNRSEKARKENLVSRQKRLIRFQYDEILYFLHYVDRSKAILENLYNQLQKIHETYFTKAYSNVTAEEAVAKIWVGMVQKNCKYMGICVKNEIVDPKQWSVCQTCQTGIYLECANLKNYAHLFPKS